MESDLINRFHSGKYLETVNTAGREYRDTTKSTEGDTISLTQPLMEHRESSIDDEAYLQRQEHYSSLLNSDCGTIKYRNRPCTVQLGSNQLIICNVNKSKTVLLKINTSDLIGASAYGREKKANKLDIYYYPMATGCCVSHKDGKVRVAKRTTLDFADDAISCTNWMNVLNYCVHDRLPTRMDQEESVDLSGHSRKPTFRVSAPPPRKVIVFVNPFGGRKLGRKIWLRTVEPMLKQAGLLVTAVITEYANHAMKYMQELPDPTEYSAVLCIGGDGIVYEVINGMMKRSDGMDLMKKLPIAHIPGGTGNGLAKSVLFSCNEACTPLNATFVAIRGHPHPLDLSEFRTHADGGTSHVSFLSMAWGLVSDIDILSESMRCLGETRLYVAAVYFMLRKRYYTARLRMKLTSSSQPLVSLCKQPVTVDPENGWSTIEGDFLLIWSVQTSHSGTTIHSGPGVKLDDGVFTLAVVEQMSFFDMVSLLLTIDTGEHVKHPKVKIYKCTEYSLEPLTSKGIFSLDGEVIPYGLLDGRVLPSAATVLTL